MTTATKMLLAVLLLLSALCAYLLWHITWVEREVDMGFSEAAQTQRYLAATLFMQSQRSDAELRRGFALVDTLFAADSPVQARDTLVLLEAFNGFSEQQAYDLLDWAEQGGTVFYSLQNQLLGESLASGDVLLDYLGITYESGFGDDFYVEPPPANDGEAELRRTLSEYSEGRSDIDCSIHSALTEFDTSNPLRVGQMNFDSFKALASAEPDDTQYGNAFGMQMIIAPWGAGKFVVTTDNRVWNNEHLSCFDHAYALQQYSSGGKTWFLENSNAQSLLSRLWQLSPLGCSLALLALLLLLHRGSRRFGPMLETPSLARRSFLEHLEAGAQLLWDRKQGAQLVEALRKDINARMQKLDYRFAGLDPAAQRDLIAHTTRLPLNVVTLAMGKVLPARMTRESLQLAVAELQKIRTLL